jgi:hypothetical protein
LTLRALLATAPTSVAGVHASAAGDALMTKKAFAKIKKGLSEALGFVRGKRKGVKLHAPQHCERCSRLVQVSAPPLTLRPARREIRDGRPWIIFDFEEQKLIPSLRGMKSERPPAETIVDADFESIERHTVASDEGAAVTAKIVPKAVALTETSAQAPLERRRRGPSSCRMAVVAVAGRQEEAALRPLSIRWIPTQE